MPTEQEVNDATARARANLQAKLDAVAQEKAEWGWAPAVAFHLYSPGYLVLFADGSMRLWADEKWTLYAPTPFTPR